MYIRRLNTHRYLHFDWNCSLNSSFLCIFFCAIFVSSNALIYFDNIFTEFILGRARYFSDVCSAMFWIAVGNEICLENLFARPAHRILSFFSSYTIFPSICVILELCNHVLSRVGNLLVGNLRCNDFHLLCLFNLEFDVCSKIY